MISTDRYQGTTSSFYNCPTHVSSKSPSTKAGGWSGYLLTSLQTPKSMFYIVLALPQSHSTAWTAKNIYPSLFWLVKLLSTINEAMQQPEAKRIKIMQVLTRISANEVVHSTPTHTATNSPRKSGSWRSDSGLLDLLIEKVKCEYY